jgi:hypothetical protein
MEDRRTGMIDKNRGLYLLIVLAVFFSSACQQAGTQEVAEATVALPKLLEVGAET